VFEKSADALIERVGAGKWARSPVEGSTTKKTLTTETRSSTPVDTGDLTLRRSAP
jgi:hypothetical protein